MESEVIRNNRQWIDSIWEKIDNKLKHTAVKSRYKIPYTTVNGVHDNMAEKDITWWTNGFWGGLMWLMYKNTGNEEYKKTALCSEKILDKAFEEYMYLHHDVGFMWHILSGANYRITGDKKACTKNLYAASLLASRYNIEGGYIRAWNGEDNEGWSIIDCMMNIPLLYWASRETKDPRFKKIAMKHADMSIRDHIRPDGSVNHIVDHDTATGEVIRTYGGQGCGEGSCWSRGSAWAIYGTVLSYIHTGKKDYLYAAMKAANYFISNCAKNDYLTPIDFRAPQKPMYYDSTAGVCAACGFLEIAKYVSESEAEMYIDAAIKILKATDEKFCDYTDKEDALVLMGSSRYPQGDDLSCVHFPIIYADFFFVEAILKLKGDDFLIW